MGFIPSCAVWPVASHPDWSVCTPWSCIETEPQREEEKGNEELIRTQRAFVLNSHSFWPRFTKWGLQIHCTVELYLVCFTNLHFYFTEDETCERDGLALLQFRVSAGP